MSLAVEIQFRARAYCRDGVGGKVSHVLINQRSWKVSFIVVKAEQGGEDWMLPLRLLESAEGKSVRLSCTQAELRRCEPFTRRDDPGDLPFDEARLMYGPGTYALLAASLRRPPETNLPMGYQALYWGTEVGAADGQVGQLHALRYEPRHQLLAGLVIRQGTLWFKQALAIPAHHIECIEPEIIQLNVDRGQLAALPAFRVHRS